ncbi:MAG: MarR family transcriptional regulator [Lachnospiraceae bacterium]|nr:MarR family transcriptional regulator [Lachnospiraceae bacterium]
MKDDFQCSGLMKRIDEKMKKSANERLGDSHGITFTQMQMLVAIHQRGKDSVPLKELERHFEVAQSTAAGVIVRLEKKGLVEGFTPSEDKRLKYVRLTEEGKALCMAAEQDMELGEQILLAGLDEQEREQFYRLLVKINASLK